MKLVKFKKILIVYIVLLAFIASFALLFGAKNITVPIVVLITGIMTLNSDFSISPKLSFTKVLLVFWACAIVAFINAPNNWFGLILGFMLIFSVTFSSFKVLTSDSHIAYIMCYLMMMCVPVSFDDFLLRLLALAVGALLIVFLNIFVHRSKHYNSRDELINDLINELSNVISAKLDNKEYYSNISNINDNLNSILFENLGYKYVDNYVRETSTTLCKTAFHIEKLIRESDLSVDELNLIKCEIINLNNEGAITRQTNASDTLDTIYLNLEVMKTEITNNDMILGNNIDIDAVKSFIKSNFSWSSLKFTFAIKLAFLLSLWEALGLLFDLPYMKWLYFSSLVVLVPFTDDINNKFTNRIKATVLGLIIFSILMVLLYSDYSLFNLLNIEMSTSTITIGFLLVLIFLVLVVFADSYNRTILTTILSLIMALKYINIEMAIPLKLAWLLVAVLVAYILTKYIFPYSIKDETKKSLIFNKEIGDEIIDLLSKQANSNIHIPKSGLIISGNVLTNHIELNNESLQDPLISQLTIIQNSTLGLSDFLLNNIQLNIITRSAREKINLILQGYNVEITEDMTYDEKFVTYITKHILNLKQQEEKLLNNFEYR